VTLLHLVERGQKLPARARVVEVAVLDEAGQLVGKGEGRGPAGRHVLVAMLEPGELGGERALRLGAQRGAERLARGEHRAQ
jgi:hypothetical protein